MVQYRGMENPVNLRPAELNNKRDCSGGEKVAKWEERRVKWHHSVGGFRRYGLSVKTGEGERRKGVRKGEGRERHEEGN